MTTPTDRYPGNEPGPDSVLFADPEQYPPTPLSHFAGQPVTYCAFGCGSNAQYMVLGCVGNAQTVATPVCVGHRDAVVAGEATWI